MALNPEDERRAALRAERICGAVGHPGDRMRALLERIRRQSLRDFAAITRDFLELMWCLDQYRIADAAPSGMGRQGATYRSRIDGIYRGKGNWFAMLLTELLMNRTGEKIRSRSKIKGFSQSHQIDLAWPDRDIAPIVCAESKLTGGPAYRDYPPRAATDDWTNRRKELKFAATDLKLSRREQTEKIGHWGVWRQRAAPRTFMLWGARLSPRDRLGRMVKEIEVLQATYLDGAGLFAWQEDLTGSGYVPVALPEGSAVESIDEALWRIESEIAEALRRGVLTERIVPSAPVDPDQLLADDLS